MADDVYYNYVTGWPEEIISTVLRKISAHKRGTKVRYY